MGIRKTLLALLLTVSNAGNAQDPKRLEGVLQVSEHGQVNYGMPINVLPTANGLTPMLSVQYSGHGQRTELGTGWSINAGTFIQRCSETKIETKKIARPPRLELSDTFCLGASRLLATKGENGRDGSEYRTVIDDAVKVLAIGQAGQGPLSFKVFRKNGHIEYYGWREEARLTDPSTGSVFTWRLSAIEDRLGNRIDYLYSKSQQNEILLEEINYGGNLKTGLAPYRALSFEYQKSDPAIHQYQQGIPSSRSGLLQKIHVWSEFKRIWSYGFSYHTADDVNDLVLKSAQICAAYDQCSQPTEFEYEKSSAASLSSQVLSQEFIPTKNWLDAVSRRILIDIDHDGFTDILGVINLFNRPNIVISFGSKEGFKTPDKVEISSINDWKSMDGYPAEVADFNRDGYADVLLGGASGFSIVYGNKSGFQNAIVKTFNFLGVGSENEKSIYSVGEANGDGYPDLIAFKGTGTYLSLGGPDGFSTPRFLFDDIGGLPKWRQLVYKRYSFDINGDGYIDIIGFNDKGTIVSLGNPEASYQPPTLWSPLVSVDWRGADTQTTFADVNGDGNIDIVARRSEGIWVSLGTGKSFLNPELWHINIHTKECPVNLGQFVVNDLNQDGFGDFILVCGKFIDVIYGKGIPAQQASKFRQIFDWRDSWLPKYPFFLDDTNGDGRTDINIFLPQGLTSIRGEWDKLHLTRVVDGFGYEQRIQWATLNESSLYKVSSEKSFPYQNLSGPIKVVKSVDTSNGIGGLNRTSYRYENAVSHFQLGFLGFETFVEFDETRHLEIATKIAINVESYLFGVPFEKSTYLLGQDRQLLKTQNFVWKVRKSIEGAYQLFNESTTEQNFEPGQGLLSTIVTKKTFDKYLNILQAESVTIDKYGSIKNSLTNVYESDESAWTVSRLIRAETVVSRQGIQDLKKVSSFEYDAIGNVKAEISEPGSPLEKRTEYKRDPLGIVTESKTLLKQSQGLDQTSITSSTTTDSKGFVVSSLSPMGHTQSFTYHPDFGTLSSQTDINGLTENYTYDHWGARSAVIRSDKVRTGTDLMWCNFICPKNAIIAITVTEDGQEPSHSYVDALGRQLRETRTAMDGRLVHRDVEFDAAGLQKHSSRPYFDGDIPQYTQYFYDQLMRLSDVKNADDSSEHYEYQGFDKIITDANHHKTTIVLNAIEQKLKTINDSAQSMSFTYNLAGHVMKITAPKGVEVSYEYDIYGRLTVLNDPSIGTVSKKYNSLDLPYEVIENDGSTTQFFYDAIGRMIRRVDQVGTSRETQYSWTYDQAKNGLGKIFKLSGPRYETTYSYDSFGRNSTLDVAIDKKHFGYEYGYDSLSRPVSTLYPTGFKEQVGYDDKGFVAKIFNAEKNYWNPKEYYADGSIKKEQLGNGVISSYIQDERNGRLLGIVSESKGRVIHSLQMNQDAAGNVLSRQDLMTGNTESFDYDNLNRLKVARSSISGVSAFDYDEIGNLQRVVTKNDVTLYKYGLDCNTGNKNPLSVCKLVETDSNGSLIKETSYTYDRKGAVVQAGPKVITYDSSGLPVVLRKGSEQVNFTYSPQGERFEREDLRPKSRSRILYLPHGLEVVEAGEKTFYRHNLAGKIVLKMENGRIEDNYLHGDHQGSVLAISDQSGEIFERFIYEPWGKKLKSNGDLFTQDAGSDRTLQGYTGHEMLDNIGLVHMNGRIYDTDLRRFISPDPFIQDPYNLQSINRYAYCWNNPMTNTDPSGYFSFGDIGRALRGIDRGVRGTLHRLDHWVQNNRSTVASLAFSAAAMAICLPSGYAAYAYAGAV